MNFYQLDFLQNSKPVAVATRPFRKIRNNSLWKQLENHLTSFQTENIQNSEGREFLYLQVIERKCNYVAVEIIFYLKLTIGQRIHWLYTCCN